MNCKHSERKILLAESGELSTRALEKLEEHVSKCQHCRQYRKSILEIVSTAKNTLPGGEPGAVVISRILAAAQEKVREKTNIFRLCSAWWDFIGELKPPIVLRQPLVRGIAYAAVIALLVGGWFMLSSNDRSGRISELNTILAMMSENDLDAIEHSRGAEEGQKLRALANQLLLMEGLAADPLTRDGAEDDFTTTEFFPKDPLEESEPTTFRLYNTAGPHSKKCV